VVKKSLRTSQFGFLRGMLGEGVSQMKIGAADTVVVPLLSIHKTN